MRFLRDYLILGKARINVMAVFTGYAAIAMCGHGLDGWALVPCLLALFFTGMSANCFNQIIEKDKDAAMTRTRHKRPLPSGRMTVTTAYLLGFGQLLISEALLWFYYQSWMAVALSLFTILYYSVFYTMYLKPRHYLNIVIGGVPGSMGPLIAWAAFMNNEISPTGLAMFAIIFLWTPPHVWALAIRLKEDYARANIPMLPVVKGVDETTRQIFIYTVVMVIGTLLVPVFVHGFQHAVVYLLLAGILGAIFLVWSLRLWKKRPVMETMPLFRYSLVYIGILFVGIVIDGLLMDQLS